MDNLRGRLGSTRKTKRGLGCNADSSTNLAAVIEGGQRSCNSEAYATPSDLSRSSNFAGRYSKRMSGMDWEFSVAATSWSGEGYGLLVVSAPDNTAPHYPRNHGNPYIGKKARLRSQQIFFGGGETRMKMRSFANLGRLTKCATPLPIFL